LALLAVERCDDGDFISYCDDRGSRSAHRSRTPVERYWEEGPQSGSEQRHRLLSTGRLAGGVLGSWATRDLETR
jgi:hypothetical protein